MPSENPNLQAFNAIPQGNSIVGVAHGKEFAVSAERNGVNTQLRSGQGLHLLPSLDIPQLDFSPIGARECLLVWTEAQGSGVSRQSAQRLAGGNVPELDTSTARRQHLAVVAESDWCLRKRIRFSRVDRPDFVACSDVPQFYHLAPDCQHPAVPAKSNTDRKTLPRTRGCHKCAQLTSGCKIPKLRR